MVSEAYDPHDWYWFIGKDRSQAWSSAAGALVGSGEVDVGRVTTIDTAESLSDVLRQYGLRVPKPTRDDVSRERDRRIALGCTVITTAGNIRVQTRDETDFRNINGLVSRGLVLKLQESSPSPPKDAVLTPFRDAEDNVHQFDSTTLISLGFQVAQCVQTIYDRSWTLKAMDPIPIDFDSDKYWSM